MKLSLLIAVCCTAALAANAQVNVTQEHNNPSRDGVYIDPAFTPSAAANLTRDLNFNGTISGNVYAQPLYIEGGPNGPMIIAVTESNNVYALNATTGLPIWSRTDIGPPVPTTPCGGFNPTGITGTPVVDLASRRLFFDALINGSPTKHFIYSLNVDTGATTAGWPVDLNATVIYNGIPFISLAQEQRGGLALVNGIVYSSYSGYVGDCGNYHGWVVGVDINNPTNVHGWATTAWAAAFGDTAALPAMAQTCLSSQGTRSIRAATGWAAKLSSDCKPARPGPVMPTDYWAPTNWFSSTTATPISAASARRSSMCLALRLRSLCSRSAKIAMLICSIATISAVFPAPLYQANVGGTNRGISAVTYHTSQGTYFGFHNDAGTVRAYKITPTNPPTISLAGA